MDAPDASEDTVETICSDVTPASPPDAKFLDAPRGRTRVKTKVKRLKKKGSAKKKSLQKLSASDTHPAAAPLDDPKLLSAVLKIQRAYRTRKFANAVEQMMLLNRKRRQVLSEILQTEKTYVKALQQLKRDFLHPLQSKLSDVEVANVFPNVNEIWKLHEHLLDRLTKLTSDSAALRGNSNHVAIAQLFTNFVQQCSKIYSPFLNNMSQGTVVLKRLMENNDDLMQAVENVTSPTGLTSGLKYLNELMITPMQRIPRYELLFRELLKCSNELHDDYTFLQAAVAEIKTTCGIINENKRRADEKYRRMFVENHATMEVLRAHEWDERPMRSVKFCAKCEKGIWGLAKKGAKCTSCGSYFHLQCRDELGETKVCLQRRRIDLTQKTLLEQADVLLLPEDEARLRPKAGAYGAPPSLPAVGPGGTNSSSTGSAGSSGSLLSVPKSSSGGSLTPATRRLSLSPGMSRPAMVDLRGVLYMFDDGLGVAHKWVSNKDEDDPFIDMLGELPWKVVVVSALPAVDNMYPFVISAGSMNWRFYLKSNIELQSLLKTIKEIQDDAKLSRELRKSAGGSKRALLAESSRFRAKISHSGEQTTTATAPK